MNIDTKDNYRSFSSQNEINKKKFCIIIGLEYINDNEKRLKGCINDTVLILRLLVEGYNYDPENITLFTDYSINKATKQNIFQKFNEYIKNINNIKSLLIYFSGHGNNNCIYLENNERLFDYEIRTNLINKLLPNTTFICILDCCKSGGFFRINNWFTNFTIYENNIKLLLISACDNNQIATEFYDKKNGIDYGLFTFYFYNLLRKYKKYSWKDILELLKEYIKKKNNQEPQIKTINYDLDKNIIL